MKRWPTTGLVRASAVTVADVRVVHWHGAMKLQTITVALTVPLAKRGVRV